jgi:hypothetical protein
VNLALVRQALGHRSITSTMQYVGTTDASCAYGRVLIPAFNNTVSRITSVLQPTRLCDPGGAARNRSTTTLSPESSASGELLPSGNIYPGKSAYLTS